MTIQAAKGDEPQFSIEIIAEDLAAVTPTDGAGALLGSSLTGNLLSSNSIVLTFQIDFVPVPIETGIVTKIECYIGATGGRFDLASANAVLENLTPDEHDKFERKTRTELEAGREFEPRLSAKPGFEVSLGGTSGRELKTVEETRTTIEPWLTGTYTQGKSRISWSRPQSNELLERNFFLMARASWDYGLPVFSTTAKPSDRRFFGPDRKPLPRRASVGVLARYLLAGKKLPAMGPVRNCLRLAPRKTGNEE